MAEISQEVRAVIAEEVAKQTKKQREMVFWGVSISVIVLLAIVLNASEAFFEDYRLKTTFEKVSDEGICAQALWKSDEDAALGYQWNVGTNNQNLEAKEARRRKLSLVDCMKVLNLTSSNAVSDSQKNRE
jgi:hypothetical protein